VRANWSNWETPHLHSVSRQPNTIARRSASCCPPAWLGPTAIPTPGAQKHLSEYSRRFTDWMERGVPGICAPPSPAPSSVEDRLPAVPSSEAGPLPSADADFSIWQLLCPGLEIRVVQTFKDYDGQEVRAGEVLHFVESSYFFYDGGHTLRFAEKTIRLADVVEEHQSIIANTGNAWFQPLGR
jgi:hypothetical protein